MRWRTSSPRGRGPVRCGLRPVRGRPGGGDRAGRLTISVNGNPLISSGSPRSVAWRLLAQGLKAEDFIWTDDEKTAWRTQSRGRIQRRLERRALHVLHPEAVLGGPAAGQRAGRDRRRARERRPRQEGPVGRRPSTSGPTDADMEEAMTGPRSAENQSTGVPAREHEGRRSGIATPDAKHFSRSTRREEASYGAGGRGQPRSPIKFGRRARPTSPRPSRRPPEVRGARSGAARMPPFPVTVTGRASSEGRPTQPVALRGARAQRLERDRQGRRAECSRRASRKGADGATGTPAGAASRSSSAPSRATSIRRARVRPHARPRRRVPDRRPARRPTRRRARRRPPDHSALAERLIPGQQPDAGAPQRQHHVANGEVVRPHHYVTFLEALGKMTGTLGKWDIAPAAGAARAARATSRRPRRAVRVGQPPR